MKVTELVAGDQIIGWMRIGFALQKRRLPNGRTYRQVPSKPDRFDKDDLQQFSGLVTFNDVENHILRVEAARMNRFLEATSESLPAEIHYAAFSRLRRVSPFAYSPRPEYPLRPTRKGIGTGFHGYRTQEEVQLIWK